MYKSKKSISDVKAIITIPCHSPPGGLAGFPKHEANKSKNITENAVFSIFLINIYNYYLL